MVRGRSGGTTGIGGEKLYSIVTQRIGQAGTFFQVFFVII
jgi:hypothetical protein